MNQPATSQQHRRERTKIEGVHTISFSHQFQSISSNSTSYKPIHRNHKNSPKNQNLVTNFDHANINIYVAPILQIEGVSNKWLHSITIFSKIITGVSVMSGIRCESYNDKYTFL